MPTTNTDGAPEVQPEETNTTSDANPALAERSNYYYAHSKRGDDEPSVQQFEPPKKIDEKELKAQEIAHKDTGVSKWNVGSYHWEETDLKGSFSQV